MRIHFRAYLTTSSLQSGGLWLAAFSVLNMSALLGSQSFAAAFETSKVGCEVRLGLGSEDHS